MNDQRILVCGAGSVGERHINNLLALSYRDIALYRRRGLPLRTVAQEFPNYAELDRALADFAPTVAFITNPTAHHLAVAQPAAEAGCHLFIEKPVSHTLDGLDQLQVTLAEHGRYAMVGYMLRFHPLLQQVQSWLTAGVLGRPLWVQAVWGEHVPDWHPWEDYRGSYAVQRALGGGPALTLSHELDLLVWLFGPAVDVAGMIHQDSPLETDCEHAADILLRFADNVVANVHLDFWQRPPRRQWELVATNGRVHFDYYSGTLTRWDGVIGEQPDPTGARRPGEKTYRLPVGWERNDMFLDELRYFFRCLEEEQPPHPGIAEAAESVRIGQELLAGRRMEKP
jgi:predicted dehydrogenase